MRRPNLAPIYRWLVMLTSALVLLQAVLAGRYLWINPDFLNYHEILANALFLVVVVQAGMTFAMGIPGSLGKRLLWLNVALAIAVVVQIGLGYSGKTDREAASWHIPLGVLIFGLTVAIAAMTPQILHSSEER